MASQVEEEESHVQLKHLGFVRILAIDASMVVSNLYGYAKQNSGPVKSTVEKVENSVTAAVGPVYDKLRVVPSDIIVFIDKKVDGAVHKFKECAPPAAKSVVFKARSILKKASNFVQESAEEARISGPLAAISRVGTISKHLAVNQLAVAWYKANQYPVLHDVFVKAVPTATHWSEKYNEIVKGMTAKGCGFSNYVPLVPVEEMTKAYKQVEADEEGKKADP